MTSTQTTRVVVPSLLLLLISITGFVYVLRVIPATTVKNGLWFNPAQHCPKLFNENYYPLHHRLFQNGGGFGATICTIFSIFDAVVQYDASSRPLVMNGIPFFGMVVTFMLVESTRSNRPYPRAYVVLITSLAQMLTGAAILPYFWIFFLRNQHKHETPSKISATDAKAAITATVLGFILPTVLFFIYPESIWLNTLWQIFPLTILISNKLSHLIFAEGPGKLDGTSGDSLIRQFYLAVFALGTALHIRTWGLINLTGTASDFIPNFVTFLDSKKGHNFQHVAALFLHWDVVFMYASALVAACWCGETVSEGVQILGWFVVATPFVGPTAAFAGFYYWREQKINRTRSLKAQ